MSTSRAALLIGLLCASSAALAADAEKSKWDPKNETWSDWPTVSFSDGKSQRLLYYRRSDAAKCDPKNKKPRSCMVDLYELTQSGEPIGIKSNRTPIIAGKKGKTEQIDSKLTSYSTALSNYKLEVNEQHLQVVQGDKHFDAVRNDAISTEGSQIFVLPPKSNAALNDAAPKTAKRSAPASTKSAKPAPKETAAAQPAPKTRNPAAQLADDLQKKTLKDQADKAAAAAANKRPPFDAEAKDQSEQFAPFMTEKELAQYKTSLKGMSEGRMLEFNNEQLKKIDGRTPYFLEEYFDVRNFDKLQPWEEERYCTNYFKGTHAKSALKSEACSKYAGKPAEPKGASGRLTPDELALLTPKERADYNAILESQKGAKNAGDTASQYRDLIKKEGRTEKHSDPDNAKEFAAMQDWQKKDFCGRLLTQGWPAPSAPAKGSKDPMRALKALNNCVESESQSCGKTVVDGLDVDGAIVAASAEPNQLTPLDWRKKACKDFDEAMAKLPPAGGGGNKPGGGDDKVGGHDPHADKKTINGNVMGPDLDPKQTPSGRSKWLAPEHLYNGAKGSLVGLLLGSLGGPMGMVGGALAGAVFFYGLSKITSDKN